jgi:FAD dependent oxidoreductase TIGR03364
MGKNAIVIGAGIVGLATARALSLKGFKVTVIERSDRAVGASIRNFGMIWPIGQSAGELYNRALRSKEIWKEAANLAGIAYNERGSLHAAYFEDEWVVLQELYEIFKAEGRNVSLMEKEVIIEKYSSVNPVGLIGGLFSGDEMIVDPRAAIAGLPNYLTEFLNAAFIWGRAVTDIRSNTVFLGKEELKADIIFICNGADFETLYPELFFQTAITKCKLQMMRYTSTEENFDLGVSLCGGLSLIHYGSFKAAPSLPHLKKRYESEMVEYVQNGIHVMVSQNNMGELTVGDSHEYGLTHDPFDRSPINDLIFKYLNQFVLASNWKLIQTWNGVYPKMTNGQNHLFLNPDKDIFILNGLGGAGMTLSFGLAEEVIAKL